MTCLQIHLFFLLLDQIYFWRYGVDFSVQSLCSSALVFLFGSFFIISLPIEFLILFMCIVFLILFVYLCSYNSLRFFKMIVQNPLSSSSQIISFGLSTWIFLFVPLIVSCFYDSSCSLYVCFVVCAFEATDTSPILYGMVLIGTDFCCPAVLSMKQDRD